MNLIGDSTARVTIELYGVPRVRTGRREVVVEASTVAQAITALERSCPELTDHVVANGQLVPSYRVSLNGLQFVTDSTTPLAAGDSLILVAADAGG